MTEFTIKDSGARQEFGGGMVRDTEEGKIDYTSCLYGPMLARWNDHMTKGRKKYPDREDGTPNWTLGATDPDVMARARRSAFRHFIAWLNGETDEDHASGVFFNINVAEFVKANIGREAAYAAAADEFEEATGASADVISDELIAQWSKQSSGLAAQESRDRLKRSRSLITN